MSRNVLSVIIQHEKCPPVPVRDLLTTYFDKIFYGLLLQFDLQNSPMKSWGSETILKFIEALAGPLSGTEFREISATDVQTQLTQTGQIAGFTVVHYSGIAKMINDVTTYQKALPPQVRYLYVLDGTTVYKAPVETGMAEHWKNLLSHVILASPLKGYPDRPVGVSYSTPEQDFYSVAYTEKEIDVVELLTLLSGKMRGRIAPKPMQQNGPTSDAKQTTSATGTEQKILYLMKMDRWNKRIDQITIFYMQRILATVVSNDHIVNLGQLLKKSDDKDCFEQYQLREITSGRDLMSNWIAYAGSYATVEKLYLALNQAGFVDACDKLEGWIMTGTVV